LNFWIAHGSRRVFREPNSTKFHVAKTKNQLESCPLCITTKVPTKHVICVQHVLFNYPIEVLIRSGFHIDYFTSAVCTYFDVFLSPLPYTYLKYYLTEYVFKLT
jgi:hypothetical protein